MSREQITIMRDWNYEKMWYKETNSFLHNFVMPATAFVDSLLLDIIERKELLKKKLFRTDIELWRKWTVREKEKPIHNTLTKMISLVASIKIAGFQPLLYYSENKLHNSVILFLYKLKMKLYRPPVIHFLRLLFAIKYRKVSVRN